jgi:3-methyladenine DNA glycosylase AlkD
MEMNFIGEVMQIISELEKAKDPTYESGMRRTVPSKQPAHATRVPEIRRLVKAWLRSHRNLLVQDVLAIADALWGTGWREERIFAIALLKEHEDAIYDVEWVDLERWSREIDNWEHVDHLADVTGRLLQMQPKLINRVEALERSYNVWQRRLALVTMIVAGRDFAWREALRRMTERLKNDDEPTIKKAVTWARRELKQSEATVG